MPLRKGPDSVSYNIEKIIQEWEQSGEINGDKIRTRKEALRKAVAIALSIAREKPKKDLSRFSLRLHP